MHAFRRYAAFTLAEVLITLGVIGIVAALTVPNLIQSSQEAQWVAGLQKFNTNLIQAVLLWKEETGCNDSVGVCLASQNLSDNVASNFDQIGKFLKIAASANGTNTVDWLPETTLNYYGDNETSAGYGKVAHTGSNHKVYLLQDGTTFSMDVDPAGFVITVDVNGKKQPNRVGKDTFKIRIGDFTNASIVCSPKDICYNKSTIGSYNNAVGLCGNESPCQDMHNVDPTIKGGAAITSYVLLNHKIPDFKALAKTIENFKP